MNGLPTNRYEALFVAIYVVFDQLLDSPQKNLPTSDAV